MSLEDIQKAVDDYRKEYIVTPEVLKVSKSVYYHLKEITPVDMEKIGEINGMKVVLDKSLPAGRWKVEYL